ncbi:kinase-like protein [Dothidotthia symphoricarpi CBS 119687]|uniref:Kinase-like protein n=1 Tax=Dothidotthia symphoricarpi CBS 119687 TaxID=1392245 RepID=A0A6A6ATJ4_9PLEO|nr:kinase-like protein [Dothidotthia symphoricarpi CBS 119687]KAF2133871.1 kinase-like protein [Dothidotthia symphoricarpi CBS 119687]
MNTELLYQQLEESRVKSTSGVYFILPLKLRDILTPAQVDLAVQEINCEAHERIGLSRKLVEDGLVTFAILIWMRRTSAIVRFRDFECLDRKLPLDETKAREIAPEFGISFAREVQWQFLPYFFQSDMCDYHRHIHDAGMVFPFVGQVEDIGEGGFGKVTKLEIPASLQGFYRETVGTVAVVRKSVVYRKRYTKDRYDQLFLKEMKSLRLLHRLKHPNIIPLLGSYTHQQEHNFLFPYFPMDLAHFLQLDTRFGDFRWDFTFPLALRGLASALEHTHDLHLELEQNGLNLDATGYHHDLRPANILVRGNTYILADFGLGGMKDEGMKSTTPWKMGTGDYLAPESRDAATFANQLVGRSIDVWAFGCLLAELATYIHRGPKGVEQFRVAREGELRPGWISTYFYSSSGQLKPSVREWLQELGNTSSTLTQDLVQVAFLALEPAVESRPSMHQIRFALDIRGFRALVSAVCNSFDQFLGCSSAGQDTECTQQASMWFELERVRVFGRLLLSQASEQNSVFTEEDTIQACYKKLQSLFCTINAELGLHDAKGSQSVESFIEIRKSFEERIQCLVQDLWDFLPSACFRKIQQIWIQSMQEDDIERLNNIDASLQAHRRQDMRDMGAIAKMKALRLQLENDTTSGTAQLLRPREDLSDLQLSNGHTYGKFRGGRVLVEWMYYRPQWESIPEVQRLMVMELKARGFSIDPEPTGLRMLKCLGFVEEAGNQGRRHGYGFLYKLPEQVEGYCFVPPVTLKQLLSLGMDRQLGSESQAPLRGKFLLAHSLALFFEKFYTVGCVHETFSSKNVIFAHTSLEMFASTNTWSQPYVVGFQKSRPDGESWATEGPPDETDFSEYEHPEYREGGRFLLEYDVYSLGLVLLEIGSWIPLQKFSQKRGHRTLGTREFRKVLLEKYVPRLEATVGTVYSKAVSACLDGSLVLRSDKVASDDLESSVFGEYIEKVVNPLEELSQLRI